MKIFLESVAIIFASYIIFGGKKSAITLIAFIALIGLLITTYLTNKHLFALEFSRICSSMRRAISNFMLLVSRKLAVEIDKETEEQQQERLEQERLEQERLEKAERKITDFFTNKLEGETKKSDDKEKAIDLRDYNIFEECENKEKEIYLVEYSYRWYLGLRAKNIFEEEMDVLQDFLNHIWNCYGIFSASELSKMHHREMPWRKSYKEGEKRLLIDDELIKNFYSYDNEKIANYLPENVALGISANGLYEIVRVRAYD